MKILQTTLLMCLTTVAVADTTLTFIGKKNKVAMQMQFADNKMRATSVDDNSSYMVYDANKVTFTMFMTDKKEYFVLDEEKIAALSDIGAMMDKMMAEQLASVPAAQREMMKGMIANMVKSQMPKQVPKAEYSMTSKSSSHNGFDCKIVIKKSGRKKSEFCVTEYSNLGMSSNEFSVITSFQHTIEALAQQYGDDNSMDFSSLGDYIPVKYKQSGESGTLSDVNHDNLDSSIFAIPVDYREMDMPF